MKLVNQSHEILNISHPDPLRAIEQAGRTCYQSQDKIADDSSAKFVGMLMGKGHMTPLEMVSVTVKFITNRGATHELVRHRLCSFSQESTRYVKLDGGMEFIKPVWFDDWGAQSRYLFSESCEEVEETYNMLIARGSRPEQAREVLPNSLKTEIIMSANLREWVHVFRLRTSKAAHPQIRALMRACLKDFQERIPIVFDEIL